MWMTVLSSVLTVILLFFLYSFSSGFFFKLFKVKKVTQIENGTLWASYAHERRRIELKHRNKKEPVVRPVPLTAKFTVTIDQCSV